MLFCTLNANAQQYGGLIVYPNVVELDFTSDSRKFVTKTVSVVNNSDKLQRVRVYIESWDYDEYGNIIFLKEPNDKSLEDYIKFNPVEFDLNPKQKQLVRITAKIPKNVSGELWNFLFFESVAGKEDIVKSSKSLLNVEVIYKTRFGVTLYAYTGDLTRKTELESLAYDCIDKEAYILAKFKNEGNVHSVIKGEISINSDTLTEPLTDKIHKLILPERSQTFKLPLPTKKMQSGEYTAKIKISYKDNDDIEQIIEGETSFTYEPSTKPTIKEQLEKPISEIIVEPTEENIAKPIELNTDETDQPRIEMPTEEIQLDLSPDAN
jgi:P pilus assembly chaperone PapD